MGEVRIHCYGCGATLPIADERMADDLRDGGWALAQGETYCPSCAQARGLAIAAPPEGPGPQSQRAQRTQGRPPVVGARKGVVVLSGLVAVCVGLLAIAVLCGAVSEVLRNAVGFRGGAVITLTALVAVAVWLPRSIWRGGNWLARLGMTRSCPTCGAQITLGRRQCECARRDRAGGDVAYRLDHRPGATWPVRYAPLGFAASVAIWIATGGILLVLGVHPSALLSIALVDITLVGVALTLARRSGPARPWQFGLRETAVRLGARTALGAYGGLMVANVAYLLLFGPFTSEKASFIANAEPAGLIVGAVILAPVAEEFFFRGFVYGTLRRRLSVPKAALATTAMFVSAHWL